MNVRKAALLSSVIVLALVAAILAVVPSGSAYDHDQTYNANATYFVSENITLPGHCSSQEVGVWVNSSVVITTAQIQFDYTYCCANVTDYTPNPEWNLFNDWNPKPYGEFGEVRICAAVLMGLGPGPVHIGNITIHCCSESYCETDLTWDRSTHETYFEDEDFVKIHIDTYGDGTFTCGEAPPPETFEKELAKGWNIISLPLTNTTDMTVASIIDESLSGSYSDLYKYDAVTKDWVPLSSSDTMQNGVGYFINMTAIDTWNYSGIIPYNRIEVSLSEGLNCIGWTNTSANINDTEDNALGSIAGKYNYVAGWNAPSPKYEVYEQHAPDVFNDFWTMERGEGYWIAAKEDCTLKYPE